MRISDWSSDVCSSDLVAVMPVALVAAAFLLSACGSSTGDRGLSGAGIGAAAGTAVCVVTGLSIVAGALIGAAAGGLTTSEERRVGKECVSTCIYRRSPYH